MATTTNKPFLTSSFSAQGSAEVLGRGSNEYTNEWSHDLTEFGNWDKFSNFPTAVRTGNFVWVLYSVVSDHVIWMLTDLVPDPDVPDQFGNNIAYPVLANYVKYEFDYTSNAEAYKASDGTLTADTSRDGDPLYALTTTCLEAAANGNTQSYFESGKTYKEIVYNGTSTGGFITANNADVPWLYGWGSAQTLLQDDNSERSNHLYGLFAPFATKAQFETLYGTEAEWIHSTSDTSNHVLFDQVYSGTNTVAYSGDDPTLTYPFTTPTFTANILYKDIPGDTNGDGINDTPSLEEALGAYAVVASALPNLDITKCKFDAKIKLPIPGLDEFSINEQINKVKAAVTSAVSSTGLLEIGKTAEGLKARLKSLLPELPEFPNLADELSKLDPSNSAAVQDLKKRWGNVVDGIESQIDDLKSIDICALVDKKAIVGEDGELSAKAEMPVAPERDIEEPAQSVYVPVPQDSMPQDDLQADTGYTPAVAKESKEKLHAVWGDIFDKMATMFLKEYNEPVTDDPEAAFWNLHSEVGKGYEFLKSEGEYQRAKAAYNRKASDAQIRAAIKNHGYNTKYMEQDVIDSLVQYTYESLKETEQNIANGFYVLNWAQSALRTAAKQVTKELKRIAKEGGPPLTSIVDPSSFWTPPAGGAIRNSPIAVGQIIPGAVWATFETGTITSLSNIEKGINRNIKEHIFGDPEVIKDLQKVMVGDPDESEESITVERVEQNCMNYGDECSGDGPGERGSAGGIGILGKDGAGPPGTVSYIHDFKTNPERVRKGDIRPDLMAMMEKAAKELNYSFVIFSGGQPSKAKLAADKVPYNLRSKLRTGSTRHDDGYAADFQTYDENGRLLIMPMAKNPGKDRDKIIKLVDTLIKHGITSIGAGYTYQNGHLHIDISPPLEEPPRYQQHWGPTRSWRSSSTWFAVAYNDARKKYAGAPPYAYNTDIP